MAVERILIAVKTYPSLSRSYDELVCTAGFRENGEWIRIYPIPFRKLAIENRYPKYAWIEVDIEKNESDPRPESFKVKDYDKIRVVGKIPSDGKSWDARRKIVLTDVHTNITNLIEGAKKENAISLACFKPMKMLDFIVAQTERSWNTQKLLEIRERAKQTDLFAKAEDPFQVVDKLPYKFSYKFEDESGKTPTLKIEEWEIGQLYWNCLKAADGNEQKAVQKVKEQYWDNFTKKDLYLFLGTTKKWHRTGKNPFIIIGTFRPDYKQPNLLDGLE